MIEECGYVVVRYDGADDGLWEDQRQALPFTGRRA
jgi:hypothetical protein